MDKLRGKRVSWRTLPAFPGARAGSSRHVQKKAENGFSSPMNRFQLNFRGRRYLFCSYDGRIIGRKAPEGCSGICYETTGKDATGKCKAVGEVRGVIFGTAVSEIEKCRGKRMEALQKRGTAWKYERFLKNLRGRNTLEDTEQYLRRAPFDEMGYANWICIGNFVLDFQK